MEILRYTIIFEFNKSACLIQEQFYNVFGNLLKDEFITLKVLKSSFWLISYNDIPEKIHNLLFNDNIKELNMIIKRKIIKREYIKIEAIQQQKLYKFSTPLLVNKNEDEKTFFEKEILNFLKLIDFNESIELKILFFKTEEKNIEINDVSYKLINGGVSLNLNITDELSFGNLKEIGYGNIIKLTQ